MKKKTIYWILGIFTFLFVLGVFIPETEDNVDGSGRSITGQAISDASYEEKSPPTTQSNGSQETLQEEPSITQTNKTLETELYRITRIIDGDTIEISSGEKVRLICIDTPETNEYYYSEASNYLKTLILNKRVELVKDISETDRYGRLLRYIYLEDGTFVNELIVYNGYGKAYPYSPDTSKCPIIKEAEQHAKDNNLGIWGQTSQEQESTSNSDIICSYNAYNCGDFSSCSEVMEVFNTCSYDVHRLDRDNDGIPCERLCG